MRKFLFISCLALSLASCKTAMLYTTLDILRPAQVGFAADAQRMLIVNNSAVQPAVVGHTNRPLFKPAEAVAVSTDSVALFALSVLAEEMDATGFFESVDLQLEPVQPDRKFDEIIPLQYATVRQLCDSFDVDVILSLDQVEEIRGPVESLGGIGLIKYTHFITVLPIRVENEAGFIHFLQV